MPSLKVRLAAASASVLVAFASVGAAVHAQELEPTRVAVEFEDSAQRECTFVGIWDTTFGQMTLEHDDGRVSGTYRTDDLLEGVVVDGVLIGAWSSPPSFSADNREAGDVEFVMAADCETFSGGYKYGSDGDWEPWEGSLSQRGAGVPHPARRGQPTDCTFSGVWDTTFGQVMLGQSGSTVEGEYADDDSRIDGIALGDVLSARWSEGPDHSELDGNAGDMELTLAADCTSFDGMWRVGASGAFGEWDGTLRWSFPDLRSGPEMPAESDAGAAPPAALTAEVAPVLFVGEHDVRPGESIDVAVQLRDADGVAALDFVLEYDPEILFVEEVAADDLVSTALLESNDEALGVIRFGLAARPGEEIVGDGALVVVRFVAHDGATRGSGLRLDVGLARDATGSSFTLDVEHGLVAIGSGPNPQYDGDGCTATSDASAALRMALAEMAVDHILDLDDDLSVTAEDARLILAGAITDGSCPDGASAEAPTGDVEPPTQLPGEPDASAAGLIPAIEFQPRAGDYAEDPREASGILRSFNTLLLVFALDALVGDVNALLAEIDAAIVGGITGVDGEASGLVFLRVPTTDHIQMDALVDLLERDSRVDVVVPDALQELDLRPPDNSSLAAMVVTPRSTCSGAAACTQVWSWEREDQPQPPHTAPNYHDGNWGLEMSRVPQMWNLNAAITKAGTDATVTGIIDAGFVDSEDVPYTWAGRQHGHGAHVAGTIAASHGNDVGIEGVTPFADLSLAAIKSARLSRLLLSMSSLINAVYDMVRSGADPRVINISMGYRWMAAPTATDRAALDAEGKAVLKTFTLLSVLGHELPLVVVSAGNSSGLDARWASGISNAALVGGADNVLVVEALRRGPNAPGATNLAPSLAPFSNINGDISAPGELVTSSYWSGPPFNTTTNQAPGVCAGTHPKCYATISGTSMAAPHVTGVASYLFSLDPSLSAREVRSLLTTNSVRVGGGASDRLDAFASALDIDALRDTHKIRRMLLDIDDGTLDGNKKDGVSLSSSDAEDADSDGGVGDGRIDMSDFRRWRDWLLITEGHQIGSDWHFKDDVNGNGRLVPDADDENVFPRGDFNGDGKLDRSTRIAVAGKDGGGVWTDLEVLQSLFVDDQYGAGELPGLIDSWDLEVSVTDCLALDGVTKVSSGIEANGTALPLGGVRGHPDGISEIFTVPAGGSHRAWLEAVDEAGSSTRIEEVVSGEPGDDRKWRPQCQAEPETTILPAGRYAVEYDDGISRGTLWELEFEYDESGTLLTIIKVSGRSRSRYVCDNGVCELTNAAGVTLRLMPSGGNLNVEVLNNFGGNAVAVRACPWTLGVGSDCN